MILLAAVLGAACTLPSGAFANVVAPSTRSLPVDVIPSLGGWSDGLATFSVAFTDTEATATLSAPSLGLGPGHVFHVDACIKSHVLGTSYAITCQQTTVDTTANVASVGVSAATATATIARPPAGGSAYLSFVVSISESQPDGSYTTVASSWPTAGVDAASVAIPSLGAASAPAATSEGAMLSNGVTGGINTGQPDSICEGFRYPSPSPPETGVSTSVFGPDAAAYYEVGEPTGAFEGQAPKGVMLIIHGGGWFMNGPAMVATERTEADQWRALGWRTVNVTYRPCYQSFADVEWFYDQSRTLWGSSLPYCALGASAGGDLALMLAAARPSLSCVISEAGPTDARSIVTETTPQGSGNGPRWVYNLLTAAVGQENIVWWSPALFPIHARVLWVISAGDPYIPWAQGTELHTKMLAGNPKAYVDLLQLPSGTTSWVHANVSSAALATFQAHEQQLVAPLVGS